MSGKRLLLDTNIVLYILGGDETLTAFLGDKELYISVITELELLSYHSLSARELAAVRNLISELNVIELTQEVKEAAILIRKSVKMKLPDAIVAASAATQKMGLISADKQFSKLKGIDVLLYEK